MQTLSICAEELTKVSSYLITDYERSSFSVSQCTFVDGVPENVVAIIPPNATLSRHMSRAVVIGMCIGAATFLLMIVLTLVFVIRRRKRKIPYKVGSNNEPQTPIQDLKVEPIYGVREIDQNSLCGPYRELPDSGKAELLDEHSPSGSGKDISEMAQALPPVVHELRTTRSSKEPSMVHIGSKAGIFISTNLSRKSWTSIDSSDGTPRIETVISSSPWHSSLALAKSSVHSFNTEREILASYSRKSLDLDRSLPPTPISESPQVSPIVGLFNHRFITPQPLQIMLKGKNKSMSAVISPKTPTSKYSTLRGLETVIPPNRSDSDVSDMSASSKEEQKIHETWF